MIVELKDKNIELEFPDDMPLDQIKQTIQKKFYPEQSAPAPSPAEPPTAEEPLPLMGIPEQVAMEDVLPGDASTKGAVVGGILGAPLGPPGAVFGSGAGAMVGDLLSQMNDRTRGTAPPDTEPLPLMGIPEKLDPAIAGRTALKFGEGAAAGVLGEGIATAAKAGAPVVGGVLEETAKMYGLPQMILKSRPWLNNIIEATPGGKWMVDKYKNQFNNWALAEREAFVKEVSPILAGNTETGEVWGEQLANIVKAPKEAYAKFGEASPGVVIDMPASRHVAHQIADAATGNDKAWADALLNRGGLTTEEINKMLGGKATGISASTKEMMRDAVSSDLVAFDNANSTTLAALREAADQSYKDVMQQWANNPLYVRLMKMYDPQMKIPGQSKSMALPAPERIIRTAFQSGDVEGLKAIQGAMPDDVFNMGLARFLENSLDSAMDQTGKILYPAKWAKTWETLGPKVEAFNPALHTRMDRWTQMITKGEDMLPTAMPKSTGIAGTIRGLNLPGAVGGMFMSPSIAAGVGVYNGFTMMAAYKWLGPEGKTLIRRYAESAAQRQMTTAAGMTGMEQFGGE
jgi:hypothetical protein